MSVTQVTAERSNTEPIHCKRCNALLPQNATFCGRCGERVNIEGGPSSSPLNTRIDERYRILEAVRPQSIDAQRAGAPALSFALDLQQQERAVIIRDIDINALTETERAQAIEAAQNEYDQLRQLNLSDLTPVIALHYYEQHIYTIAGWPQARKPARSIAEPFPLLQSLLKSESALPDEEVALTWAYRLCQSIQRLHEQQIVFGNLDPYTVAVNGQDYDGFPALMLSWLPQAIHPLLQRHDPSFSIALAPFSAPEVRYAAVEPRSDIYSIGALLYLLLTGREPEAEPTQIRAPHDIKAEVSSGISQAVMQALAQDPSQRFHDAEEFAIILLGLCSSTRTISPAQLSQLEAFTAPATKTSESETAKEVDVENGQSEDGDAVTIKVSPLQAQQAFWYLNQLAPEHTNAENAARQTAPDEHTEQKNIYTPAVRLPRLPRTEASALSQEEIQRAAQMRMADVPTTPFPLLPQAQRTGLDLFRQRLAGRFPGFSSTLQATLSTAADLSKKSGQLQSSWFKRFKQFILGEQQRITNAAALIEAPLRIQPGQSYTLRIHLLGRDRLMGGKAATGLSSLIYGELVHIEVRSALYQNFAYVVQQADVAIPAQGFAAEVSIPMQPLADGPNGRRERLHILFSDQLHRPLYERPFVLEIYTSHLVQSGQEGHNALTIPL